MADWTCERVAERREGAADTLRRPPESTIQRRCTRWLPIIRDAREAYGRDEVRVRLGPPSPAAIDRMDETFTWLKWLDPEEVRLVWMRACRIRRKPVCYRFGVARQTAWRRWMTARISIATRFRAREKDRGRVRRTA